MVVMAAILVIVVETVLVVDLMMAKHALLFLLLW
jgi:hypothetical protein